MRNFKKVIAAGLALLMLALSVNVSFAAENYTDAEAVAVAKVNAAKIMTGTDKGFEPTKTLTRAEAAAIFVRMKGISEDTVKQNAGTTLFTDVAATHWAAGYINVASNYGIIVGVGAGKFAPEKEVTVAEFYTMATRALGAGKLVDSEGTWPTNYVNFAIENDLAEDVQQIYTATSTRITAAIIAANTLEAKLWEKSQVKSNGEITWEAKNKTIIENVLKYVIKDEDGHKLVHAPRIVSNIDKTIDGMDCDKDLDLSNIKIGMTYEYWINKDGDIAGLWIPKSKDSVEFTEIKDFEINSDSTKAEVKLVVDGKEKTYKFDLDQDEDSYYIALPQVIANEKTVEIDNTDIATVDDEDSINTLAEVFKDNKNLTGIAYIDDDNMIRNVYVTVFTDYAVVKEASEKKVTFKNNDSEHKGFTSSPLSLTTKDKEYFLSKDGKAMEFADLEEDDVIRYYEVDNKKIVAEVISAAASGKVQSVRKASGKLASVKIDGTSYDVTNKEWTINADDEISIYLNNAGKIAAFVKEKESAADMAVIVYARKVTERLGENLAVKLALTDGTITDEMVIDLDESANKLDGDENNGKAYVSADYVEFGTDGSHDAYGKYNLGDLVAYEVKNGKVVLKSIDNSKVGYITTSYNSTASKYVTDVDSTYKYYAELTIGSRNNVITQKEYISSSNTKVAKAYLTDSTKVYNLKYLSTSASNFDYELKVEEVDVEDLDNMKSINGYCIGVDETTKEIETLFISPETTVARTSETNFAFITKVWETKVDDEDVSEIEVILMNGSKETYIVNSETTGAALAVAGNFVDLAVKDDVVYELDALNVAGDDYLNDVIGINNLIRNSITSSRIALTDNGVDRNEEILLADQILVLEANKATTPDKWTVKDLNDIETYGDTAEYNASTKVDKLLHVVTYQADAKDEPEVVLVVYVDNVAK